MEKGSDVIRVTRTGAGRDTWQASAAGSRQLPGEIGVWVFVLGDMLVFGLLFGTFMFYRAADPASFAQSQLALDRNLGASNTLLLLCSSWLVAASVQYAKALQAHRVLPRLACALLCAFGFVGIKAVEYTELVRAGMTPATNDFFMLYFVLTGLHLLHLLLGMAVLTYLGFRFRAKCGSLRALESGATFWHLVDLLWIILFPLVYLVR